MTVHLYRPCDVFYLFYMLYIAMIHKLRQQAVIVKHQKFMS